MKRFNDLTAEQKEQAVEKALTNLLRGVVDASIMFADELNGDDLQARINAAAEEAEAMQTPWFAGEYIMDAVGDELRAMSRPEAEDAFYPEQGEAVIYIS